MRAEAGQIITLDTIYDTSIELLQFDIYIYSKKSTRHPIIIAGTGGEGGVEEGGDRGWGGIGRTPYEITSSVTLPFRLYTKSVYREGGCIDSGVRVLFP